MSPHTPQGLSQSSQCALRPASTTPLKTPPGTPISNMRPDGAKPPHVCSTSLAGKVTKHCQPGQQCLHALCSAPAAMPLQLCHPKDSPEPHTCQGARPQPRPATTTVNATRCTSRLHAPAAPSALRCVAQPGNHACGFAQRRQTLLTRDRPSAPAYRASASHRVAHIVQSQHPTWQLRATRVRSSRSAAARRVPTGPPAEKHPHPPTLGKPQGRLRATRAWSSRSAAARRSPCGARAA